MSTVVLRCDNAPVPIALSDLAVESVPGRPAAADIDEMLPVLDVDSLPHIIVLGDDADLAAVLTHLMRIERLDVPLGFVPSERTYGARRYRTGTGSVAAKRAIKGHPVETPLIRDDSGTVLVGRASIVGPDGRRFDGEAYVDENLLFRGKVREVNVAANLSMPGLSGRFRTNRYRKSDWLEGRAFQLGTPGAIVVRDGIPADRQTKRVAFYRHHEPWLLMR